MRVLVFAAALYLLVPGHPDVILSGVPLGQTGTVLVIALLVAWAWTRDVIVTIAPGLIRAFGVAIAVKFALALVVPHSGWVGAYYANDQLQPPVRDSVDFSLYKATRIDRQLSFVDTEFPVHFFNEHGFNFGLRREATEAFSVEWMGIIDSAEPVTVRYDARGEVQFSVDDVVAAASPVTVAPGSHVLYVQYRKPKVIEGALRVQPLDANGAPRDWTVGEITPDPVSPAWRTAARWLVVVAWGVHLIAAGLVIAGLGPALAAKLRQVRTLRRVEAAQQCVMPVVMLGLTLQGLWKSRHLVDHVFTLTGGDDWLAFEMNAREILFNGWLLPRGDLPGKGVPYYEYPGYAYFVAGAHWLTGDSLAGVILINFVCLALATVLVHAIATRLTDQRAALIAVAWLLALEQMDFVRYYTVTLLSENLFVVLVALTLYLFVRFVREGQWWTVVVGAAAGGLATATRPTLLLFLPVAMILLPLARLGRDRVVRAAAVPLVVIVFWLGAISPFTYRNYVMTGKTVMLTEGQAGTFIEYNLPNRDAAGNLKYFEAFTGSMASAVRIMLWILWEHPAETLNNWGIKAGFVLGMVHWMGSGTPHPELVLTSIGYLLALILVREARSLGAWLLHGFVWTHLATMMLSMPSNYGYRLILPMYVFMVIFAAALIAKPIARWLDRGAAADAALA